MYAQTQNTHLGKVPLTTRYLSIACTKARGSILTGPPFHCFTFAQSGCLCNWHFNWCVLKNFKACDPLLREKLKIICEKKLFYYFQNQHNTNKRQYKLHFLKTQNKHVLTSYVKSSQQFKLLSESYYKVRNQRRCVCMHMKTLNYHFISIIPETDVSRNPHHWDLTISLD